MVGVLGAAILIRVRIRIPVVVAAAPVGWHPKSEHGNDVVFVAGVGHGFGFIGVAGALTLQSLLHGQSAIPTQGDVYRGLTGAASTRVPASTAGITASTAGITTAARISKSTAATPHPSASPRITGSLLPDGQLLRPWRIRKNLVNFVVGPLRVVLVLPRLGRE